MGFKAKRNKLKCILKRLSSAVPVSVALGLYLYHNGTKTAEKGLYGFKWNQT